MKEVLLFDLDNCLCPAHAVGELFAPAFDVIRRAASGLMTQAAIDAAIADCWFHAIDWVADRHHFPPSVRAAALDAYSALEVTTPLRGYDDLAIVRTLPARRYLITTGFRRLQSSKIRALGIEDWFAGVFIDAIDEPGRLGKQGFFAQILATGNWTPAQALAIGDNPHSELLAARRLGIESVQTLRPGVVRSDDVDHHVASLHELARLLG